MESLFSDLSSEHWKSLDVSVKMKIIFLNEDGENWYDTLTRLMKMHIRSQINDLDIVLNIDVISRNFINLREHIANGGRFETWTFRHERKTFITKGLKELYSPMVTPQKYTFNPFSVPIERLNEIVPSGYKTPERRPSTECPGAPPRRRARPIGGF